MNRILMALVLLTAAARVEAAGLRTPFGEVIIKNLKIGQTYSMYKLVNLPIRIINTGDETTDLVISPIAVKPEEARAGYAPVPSTDWVRVERSSFTLEPNREAVSDVIITIPNDPSLLGRSFQADIWSHTIGARALLVGLRSQLFLHIDSTPPTDDELKKKFVDETLSNLDFSVMPVSAQVTDIPLGHEIDLRKERKIAIKIINPNDRALNFRVHSIATWESMLLPPSGYESADDPKWLKPEHEMLKIDANSISDTSLKLEIPDVPRYSGAHLFFIVSFEVLEQKIPTRVYYRLLVDTLAAPKAGAAVKK
jgi:hypothetical protein